MGDYVETMLTQVMTAIMANDRRLAGEVSKMDNVVDHLTEAIKLYIAKLTRGSLDEREGRRAMEIVSFAINLEHVGDIIDKSTYANWQLKRASGNCNFRRKVLQSLYRFTSGFARACVSPLRCLWPETSKQPDA